jgi:hypothetical protein
MAFEALEPGAMASNDTSLVWTDNDEDVSSQPTVPLTDTSIASAGEVFIKLVTPNTIRAVAANLDLPDIDSIALPGRLLDYQFQKVFGIIVDVSQFFAKNIEITQVLRG